MQIILITPAKKHSRSGNRATAVRWARMLENLGHSVNIAENYDGAAADMMIAIHAWRTAETIELFKKKYPGTPLIVALGGTDVNSFLKTEPETTMRSMDLADALICLHALIGNALPQRLQDKLHLIRQSAEPLRTPRRPRTRSFGASVIGHLREEKDPFRAALAARLVPPASKLRVTHLGKAHTDDWALQAQAEMTANPRYVWKGEVPGWQVRREFSRTHLMVITSNQEGGANVVSEALVAEVPVIASDIEGNIGLLGTDYEGYFPLGNEQALANILWRSESDSGFLKHLAAQCAKLKPKFTPESEQKGLDAVVRFAAARATTSG